MQNITFTYDGSFVFTCSFLYNFVFDAFGYGIWMF